MKRKEKGEGRRQRRQKGKKGKGTGRKLWCLGVVSRLGTVGSALNHRYCRVIGEEIASKARREKSVRGISEARG